MTTTTTLDINNQLDSVVVVVKNTVGSLLSQVKSSGSTATTPAVIKKRTTDRSSTNQPSIDLPYPYSMVDYIDMNLWGGGELLNVKYADNGNRIYETDYVIKLSVDFVGRQQDNVHSIAHRMHTMLKTSEVRNKISDLTNGRLFKISNDIRKGMIQRSTEWVDMSTFFIDIIFRDVLETDSEGNIVQIIVNGELHEQFIDPDPILIHIDTNGV
jgi:hypothetical protein